MLMSRNPPVSALDDDDDDLLLLLLLLGDLFRDPGSGPQTQSLPALLSKSLHFVSTGFSGLGLGLDPARVEVRGLGQGLDLPLVGTSQELGMLLQ